MQVKERETLKEELHAKLAANAHQIALNDDIVKDNSRQIRALQVIIAICFVCGFGLS